MVTSVLKIKLIKLLDAVFGRMALRALPRSLPRVSYCCTSFLLIRPGGIGDAVHLIPAITLLKKHYPDVDIDVLAENRNHAVFLLCEGVRRVFRYDRSGEFWSALRSSYDVVIDTEQWHRLSATFARFTRAPVTIGFATNERGEAFTHPIDYYQDDYEIDSFVRLVEPLGCGAERITSGAILSVPTKERDTVDQLLDKFMECEIIVLAPGASIPERRWGAEKFRSLAEKLNNMGIAVAIVGGNMDVKEGDKIVKNLHGISLAGKTSLVESAAIIAQSSLLISGDSGILHIGVGLGVPTVSLFGPGRTRKWAPRGENHLVINKELPCSPCTTFGYTPKCPIHARCMADISVEEVEQAVLTLLARKNFDKDQQKP